MPIELDELERRRIQLEIEREALRKETDDASKARLEALEKELADLEEQAGAMKQRWEAREGRDRGDPRHEVGARSARRSGSSRPSARPTTARPPSSSTAPRRSCSDRLDEQEAALAALQGPGSLLKEEVDADDIAEIVARWTGIPVSRLLEGETAKLIQMEERLHERVVGQDEAIAGRVRRGPARAGRAQGPEAGPIGSFLFLGPDRRRQDRAGARARRVPVRRRARAWSAST